MSTCVNSMMHRFMIHFRHHSLMRCSNNVGGQEVYSFTDGFSGYHQIRIAPEDRHKTTFATEMGSFQYTVMPFGLKNAPAIFSRVVISVFKEYIHKFLEVYFDD